MNPVEITEEGPNGGQMGVNGLGTSPPLPLSNTSIGQEDQNEGHGDNLPGALTSISQTTFEIEESTHHGQTHFEPQPNLFGPIDHGNSIIFLSTPPSPPPPPPTLPFPEGGHSVVVELENVSSPLHMGDNLPGTFSSISQTSGTKESTHYGPRIPIGESAWLEPIPYPFSSKSQSLEKHSEPHPHGYDMLPTPSPPSTSPIREEGHWKGYMGSNSPEVKPDPTRSPSWSNSEDHLGGGKPPPHPSSRSSEDHIGDCSPEESESLAGIEESPPLDQILSSGWPRIQRASSIFRSKKRLKKHFEPKLYSFGPIHHGNPTLHNGEEIKIKLAAAYIYTQGLDPDELSDKIKQYTHHFRQFYDEEIIKEFDDDALSRIFFVDGCALLYYIIHAVEYHILGLRSLNFWPKLCHADVFRLENQLPYELLSLLMTEEKINSKHPEDYINIFIAAYSFLAPSSNPLMEEKSHIVQKIMPRIHILNVLWRYTGQRQLPQQETPSVIDKLFRRPQSTMNKHMPYGIKKLKQAGIRVKPSKSHHLTEVSFNGGLLSGRLTLAPVRLYPMMASELANLMAYEMCADHPNDFPITSYVCFLKSLVRDAQDLAEMKSAGILHNYLSSDKAVIKLLNKLASDVNPNTGIYSRVISAITNFVEYSRFIWIHRVIAWILAAAEVYFTTPQNAIPFVAAALALGLAITNTIFTILHQSKDGGS